MIRALHVAEVGDSVVEAAIQRHAALRMRHRRERGECRGCNQKFFHGRGLLNKVAVVYHVASRTGDAVCIACNTVMKLSPAQRSFNFRADYAEHENRRRRET
jgi:hypothetical protein